MQGPDTCKILKVQWIWAGHNTASQVKDRLLHGANPLQRRKHKAWEVHQTLETTYPYLEILLQHLYMKGCQF